MIGGFLKSTSCLALLAAAGIVAGGVSAQAADLGGNCCADLEERVAELEATTARKGNRKVSLQIYGQVSEAVMWWNDGKQGGTYIQENNAVKNILGFTGAAKINSDWSAGYKLEIQIRAHRSSAANQLPLGETNGVGVAAYNITSEALRQAYVYLESQTYGTVTVGDALQASVGANSVNLANPDGFQAAGGFMGFANGGFFLRSKTVGAGNAAAAGDPRNGGNTLSSKTWGNYGFIPNGDGPAPFDYVYTEGIVKYTSPFLFGQSKNSGFQFQTSYGANVSWDAALRYVEDYGIFRVAAAVSYLQNSGLGSMGSCANATGTNATVGTSAIATQAATNNVSAVRCETVQYSGSLMHTPTGLYVSGGGAMLTDENRQRLLNIAMSATSSATVTREIVNKNDSHWWVQAGWEAKLNTLGKTTFYGTYNVYNRGAGLASNYLDSIASTDSINSLTATAFMTSSQTKQWGVGVTQAIDAAAMNLYMGYMHSDITMNLSTGINGAAIVTQRSNALDSSDIYYTGATIKF